MNAGGRQEFSMARLTYDGQYALWADERFIRAARVKDAQSLGYICTHEKPVTLQTLDFGYLIVIGREDGHVITARLVEGLDHLPPKFKPQNLKDRTTALLDHGFFPDGLIATLDPVFQTRPKPLNNDSLPKISDEIKHMLEQRAKIPHAVIKTPSAGNLLGSASPRMSVVDKKRRGSSPIAFFTNFRSRDQSPSSASNSPVTLKKRVARISPHASPKTLPRRQGATRNKPPRKSPSMSDLFNVTSTKPPKAPTKNGKDEKDGGKGEMFTLNNAMQKTGYLAAMAMSDMRSLGHHVVDTVSGKRHSGGARNGTVAERCHRRKSVESSSSSSADHRQSDVDEEARRSRHQSMSSVTSC